MHPFRLIFLLCFAMILIACEPFSSREKAAATFVDEQVCANCHEKEAAEWRGSQHDLAMQIASDATVLGDFDNAVFAHFGDTSRFYKNGNQFFVFTEDSGGKFREFRIEYTFGVYPLQQYLVAFPGGRLQALSIAWDVPQQRWFHLYPDETFAPDDALHWTGAYQNWNTMCAECHSTNLRINYDFPADSFRTAWDQIDVGCQACHGAGSAHVEWANRAKSAGTEIDKSQSQLANLATDADAQILRCAPCHSRRHPVSPDDTSANYFDNFMPELLREPLYHADGQILDEVYVFGSFTQSKMYQNGVKCSDCHNPHSARLLATGNALCVSCHNPGGNPRFPKMPTKNYDSPEHHFHKTGGEGALCVNCHMPQRNFMVIDSRRDHSFRVPRPDLTVKIGTPNACTDCHSDKSAQWAMTATENWYGKSAKTTPHFGEIFAAARSGDATIAPQLLAIAADSVKPAIVRATALELLQQFSGEHLSRAIKTSAIALEPLIRTTAATALAGLPPEHRIAAGVEMLSDKSAAVRMEAARNLAGLAEHYFTASQRDLRDAALADYIRLQLAAATQPTANFNLALLFENLAQPDSAIVFYERTLRIDPYFSPAYQNLANLLNRNRQNDRAEIILRRGIQKIPGNGELHYSLGLLLAEEKRLDEAAAELRRAKELLPESSRVYYNYALALQHLGQLDLAEIALLKAHQLNQKDLRIIYAIAILYIQQNQLDNAEIFAQQLAGLLPSEPGAQQLLQEIRNRKSVQ
ncbi:MAG: tetratricopeptide repeat protein [Calditrichia bacterium]